MENNTTNKKPIRWSVFVPCFLVIGGAAILGPVADRGNKGDLYLVFDLLWLAVSDYRHSNSDISGYFDIFQNREYPFWRS